MSDRDLFRKVTGILKDNGFAPVPTKRGGHLHLAKEGLKITVSYSLCDRNRANQIFKQAQIHAKL